MKKSITQTAGFALGYVFLGLLLIGAGAFAGYRVMQTNEDEPAVATRQASTEEELKPSCEERTQEAETQNKKAYCNEEYGWSFFYEPDWKLIVPKEEYEGNASVMVESPDFKTSNPTDEDYCTNPIAGIHITVASYDFDPSRHEGYDEVDHIMSGGTFLKEGTQPRELTVDGVRAAEHISSPGECLYFIRTAFEDNEVSYGIGSAETNGTLTDDHLAKYHEVVESFRFIR